MEGRKVSHFHCDGSVSSFQLKDCFVNVDLVKVDVKRCFVNLAAVKVDAQRDQVNLKERSQSWTAVNVVQEEVDEDWRKSLKRLSRSTSVEKSVMVTSVDDDEVASIVDKSDEDFMWSEVRGRTVQRGRRYWTRSSLAPETEDVVVVEESIENIQMFVDRLKLVSGESDATTVEREVADDSKKQADSDARCACGSQGHWFCGADDCLPSVEDLLGSNSDDDDDDATTVDGGFGDGGDQPVEEEEEDAEVAAMRADFRQRLMGGSFDDILRMEELPISDDDIDERALESDDAESSLSGASRLRRLSDSCDAESPSSSDESTGEAKVRRKSSSEDYVDDSPKRCDSSRSLTSDPESEVSGRFAEGSRVFDVNDDGSVSVREDRAEYPRICDLFGELSGDGQNSEAVEETVAQKGNINPFFDVDPREVFLRDWNESDSDDAEDFDAPGRERWPPGSVYRRLCGVEAVEVSLNLIFFFYC